jgi:tetraacyldisaccharide-1-P 4'-kinase
VLTSEFSLTDGSFQVKPIAWINVLTGKKCELNAFKIESDVMAIAGIGNPDKFKRTLNEMGIHCPHK